MDTLAGFAFLAGVVGFVVLMRRFGRFLSGPVQVRIDGTVGPPETWLPLALQKAKGLLPAINWTTSVHEIVDEEGGAGAALEGRMVGGGYEVVAYVPNFHGVQHFPSEAPLVVSVDWREFIYRRNLFYLALVGKVPLSAGVNARSRLVTQLRKQARRAGKQSDVQI